MMLSVSLSHFSTVSYTKKKTEVSNKITALGNTICRLFGRRVIDELDIVHEHLFS